MVMRIPEQVRLHREKILREVSQMLGHSQPHCDSQDRSVVKRASPTGPSLATLGTPR